MERSTQRRMKDERDEQKKKLLALTTNNSLQSVPRQKILLPIVKNIHKKIFTSSSLS